MKITSLCAVLLWSCWQFSGPIEASIMDVDVPGGRDLRAMLQKEACEFDLRLDEVTMGEHERFYRSLDGLHRNRMNRDGRNGNRVKRGAVSDFRHGFNPGTGVGNREDFAITSLELVSNTSVVNGSAGEWGHLVIDVNETIVTAMTEEALLVYKLWLDDPDEPLSLITSFPNVICFEIYERSSWQVGHIVKTSHYLTVYDSTLSISHYELTGNNITLTDSVDLGPLLVVDIQHFAFEMVTYLGVLTGNGFARLYRWSSRYCKFSIAEDLTVPVPASNMQTFDISGRHYLLVSSSEAESTLFKYHSRQNGFRQYQLLYPEGAKHVAYFTDAYEHYLVFIDAMGQTSTFFKWNGVEFTLMQVHDTVAANHWHAVAVPGTQDGTLLILSSDGSAPGTQPLMPYKHDPLTDTFEVLNEGAVISALNPPEYIDATSTLSFHIGTDVYLLVGVSKHPSLNEPGNLFKMTFMNIETESPVVMESLELEAKIIQLESEINRLNAELAQASQTISESVTKDGDETIRGNKIFTEADMEEAEVEQINVEDAYIYAPKPVGNDSLSYLVNQSMAQQEQIRRFQEFLSDAVTLNTTQTVTAAKNITSVTIEGALNSTVFRTVYFDGVDVDELNRQAFRLDVPNQVINGALTFSRNLTSTKNINLDDGYRVNDLDLSEDVVLTHGAQTITGEKIIQQDTAIQDNVVLGSGVLLNDIDPSEHLVTLSDQHLIAGRLNFTDVIHIDGDISTRGTVDGVDVSAICIDVMTISTNQTVSGALTFQQPPVFDTDVVYGSLLQGVNITQLNDKAVRINQNTEITGDKSFQGYISVTGDVVVDGNVNGVDLSAQVVELAYGGTMQGMRDFAGTVTVAGALTLDGDVNGLDLSQDVVSLKGDHTIRGNKTFTDGIDAAQNIHVTGNVDTIDLSAWADEVMTLSTNQTVQGPIVFMNDTNMEANLTVGGLINDIDLLAMYRDTFFKTSERVQIISGNKTFTKPLNVTSGQVVIEGLINGYNVTEDFLNKFSVQIVTGQKSFLDGFSADAGLDIAGLIAGIHLEALYNNSLIIGRQAHLIGQRTFLGNVKVDGVVNVTGNVDGIRIATDVLTIHGNQVVTGLKSFKQLEAHNMSSEDVNAAIFVNKKNWTDFVLTRVDLTSDQEISANHTINADVTVNNVEIKWIINTVNLTALLNDVMSKTAVQTVTGSKTITGTFVVNGNVSLGDHINGVLLNEFAARAMLLEGPLQTIAGSKTFDDLATLSEHLTLTGLLDGLNLDFFMSDIIFPDNLQKILATKTFLNGFDAEGNITVSGNVDGIDLSEEVMTKNTAQNISGAFTVTGSILTTASNTIVTGLINGIDLVYLNNNILKTSGDQTVASPLVFVNNLISTTDVTVTELVDGVDLSKLKLNAIDLNQAFNLTGNQTFIRGVIFEGPVEVIGMINGKNLSAWYQDVVLLYTDENILGNKTFDSNVTVSGVVNVVGDMEVDTVFGIDFDGFVSDAVNLTSNVTITGEKTFSGNLDARADVFVGKTIDGIYVEDIVTLDGDEILSGVKTFTQNMTVNGHINVTELVNGINISDIYERTFKMGSPQNVTATKEFAQDVKVTENIFIRGSVNGVELDIDAVTLDTNQTIDGTIFFSALLTVNGNMTVEGYVAGVNFTDLVTERATLAGNETVRGVLTFQGFVSFQEDVTVVDLFGGVPLSDLWDWQTELLRWVRLEINNLLWISADQCDAVNRLQWDYANAVENLAYISMIQEINLRIHSVEAFILDGVRHLALAVYKNNVDSICVDSYVYVWDSDRYEFVEKASFATNGAYSWHAFKRWGTQYLAVANEGTNPCNGGAGVNNVIYSYNGSNFVEHQQLESDDTREMDSTVIDGDLYLALANTKTNALSTVYWQAPDGLFYIMQNFSVGGATDVEFVHIQNTTLLVFAAVSPTQSPVYIFNSQSGLFDIHQYISTSYASSVDSFRFHDSVGVAFANNAERFANNKISYTVPIEVFFWWETTNQFELFQRVEFTGAVDIEMFHIGQDLYLAAVSEYEDLQVFRHEGVTGFNLVLTVASYGAVSVEVFEIPDLPTDENLFFALSVDPYTEDDVSSKILREKVLGTNLLLGGEAIAVNLVFKETSTTIHRLGSNLHSENSATAHESNAGAFV